MSLLRWSRSRFKPRTLQNLSQPSEFATEQLSSPACICLSSPSHQAQVEPCEDVDSSHAGGLIMCGCNSSPRLEEASGTSYPVSRREGEYPLATLAVVDVTSGPRFHCPTLLDDTGRETGEEAAGHTASPRGRSRNQAKRRKEEQQETFTNFDISNSQRRIGALETTTNRRLACESVGMSARDRVKSVSGECSPGMDDLSVMRSSLDSNDGTKRHTEEEGSGCDTAQLDASMSRLRKSDTLPTNLRQEGDVLRLQSISPMQKGGARTTYYGITCFTVCALVLGGAASRDSGNANGCRISQLQHVGSSSRPTTRKRLLVGATPVSFVFWNHGTESGQGNSSVVPRSTKEGHCGSSNQETEGNFCRNVK